MEGEIKELAAGTHCTVFESYRARRAEIRKTYAALRAMNQNIKLPMKTRISQIPCWIAAVPRATLHGGFAVEISRGTNGEIKVLERGPKGGMVIQVLTTAFRIVSVPVATDRIDHLGLESNLGSRD